MKKVLFASTALVMTAGFASAEVTLSGSAELGATSTDGGDWVTTSDVTFEVNGSVTTDSGITFTASQEIGAAADETVSATMSFGGATVTMGDGQASPADVASVAGVGYDLTIGTVDAGVGAENMDITVAFDMGDAAVGVGYDVDSEDFALGLTTSVGGVDLALGYESDDSLLVGIGFSAGDLGVNLVYADAGAGGALGADMSYTAGDATITVAVTEDSYGLGVSYAMGDATIAAGFGDNNGTSVMDFGVDYDLGGATLSASYTDNGTSTVTSVGLEFDF